MFKCTECGMKYKTQPDYCRCGNDLFSEIEVQHPVKQTIKTDILYYTIFAICILLSLCVVLFGNNKANNSTTPPIKNQKNITSIIPNIDEFWDNSIDEIQNQILEPQSEENSTKNIVSVVQPQTATDNKSAISQLTKKIKSDNSKKVPTLNKGNTSTLSNNPKTIVHPKDNFSSDLSALTSRIQNNINYTQNSNSVSNNVSHSPIETKQNKHSTTLTNNSLNKSHNNSLNLNSAHPQQMQKSVTSQQTDAILRQELSNYKISLRNAISRKIDFTRVIGDGECILSFKVDFSGKLVSKKFEQQSDNITLNEQAFRALNTTSAFSAPPKCYNNEKLTLKIKFYNGNFEVSLN